MDIEVYARYPFIQESSQYVNDKGYLIEDIISKLAYERARARGKKRVLNSIAGESQDDSVLSQPEVELLSYPVARMIVSIIGDEYLYKRYALYEAKRAYALLIAEKDDDLLLSIGRGFGINARVDDRDIVLHFTDYLRYSASFKDMSWKLINRKMINGMVYIPHDSFARLLEEAIREKVYSTSMTKVPEKLIKPLEQYVAEVRSELDKFKAERNLVMSGEVSHDAFPPCMNYLLSELQKGTNLPHTARFALTSFLANIGLGKEEIMELYRMAPDFREDLTRYQVEHITGGGGTEYTCPSCKTMITYGNCNGKNRMCEWVTHPLSYYRKALSRQSKTREGKQQADKKNAHADTG